VLYSLKLIKYIKREKKGKTYFSFIISSSSYRHNFIYIISKNIFYLKVIKEYRGRLNHGIRNVI
jgi:hypothetical protein